MRSREKIREVGRRYKEEAIGERGKEIYRERGRIKRKDM